MQKLSLSADDLLFIHTKINYHNRKKDGSFTEIPTAWREMS